MIEIISKMTISLKYIIGINIYLINCLSFPKEYTTRRYREAFFQYTGKKKIVLEG